MTDTSPTSIASVHHASFEEAGKARWRVIAMLYGPAFAAVLALGVTETIWPDVVELDESVGGQLAAALALLAGILFALGVTVFEKAVDMDLAGPEPGASTTTAARRLQALSANALFTSLLAGGATGLILVGSLVPAIRGWVNIAATGAVVAVGTHGVAVAGRMFADTKGRSERARTGLSRDAHDSVPRRLPKKK